MCLFQIINSNAVIQFLRSAGYSYTKKDLLQSEMTVLKTLDFHINIQSPFTFVEMLLEVLGKLYDIFYILKFTLNVWLVPTIQSIKLTLGIIYNIQRITFFIPQAYSFLTFGTCVQLGSHLCVFCRNALQSI